MSAEFRNELQTGWTRFMHGAFECTVVTDGLLHMGPPRDTFPEADVDDLDQLLAHHFLPTESIALNQNVLLVNTGAQLILFDTGVGINQAFGVKTFGPDTGQAIVNMKAAGIDPAAIDIVALTHTHPDHCWGLVDDDDRKLFPNARVAVSRADLDYWTNLDNIKESMSEHMKDHFLGARKNLAPYLDTLMIVEDGKEIVPGVRAHATPGHSPGHMIYEITAAEKRSSAGATSAITRCCCCSGPNGRFASTTTAARRRRRASPCSTGSAAKSTKCSRITSRSPVADTCGATAAATTGCRARSSSNARRRCRTRPKISRSSREPTTHTVRIRP